MNHMNREHWTAWAIWALNCASCVSIVNIVVNDSLKLHNWRCSHQWCCVIYLFILTGLLLRVTTDTMSSNITDLEVARNQKTVPKGPLLVLKHQCLHPVLETERNKHIIGQTKSCPILANQGRGLIWWGCWAEMSTTYHETRIKLRESTSTSGHPGLLQELFVYLSPRNNPVCIVWAHWRFKGRIGL